MCRSTAGSVFHGPAVITLDSVSGKAASQVYARRAHFDKGNGPSCWIEPVSHCFTYLLLTLEICTHVGYSRSGESSVKGVTMQNPEQGTGTSRLRPAFHFPPLDRFSTGTARFQIVACLPDGKTVVIGHARSYRDAQALARLVPLEAGLEAVIIDSAAAFRWKSSGNDASTRRRRF